MPKTTQEHRLLELQTPLGKDVLLIRSIQGREAISQLYSFEIDAFGSNDAPVDFSVIVGQPVVASAVLKDHTNRRYFHGIVKSFVRGARNDFNTSYRMEIVPTLWLLTQRTRSRIFQQISVPDILKKVLEGLDTDFEISGTFEPRDYCVQYRESDFAFASRIMEEEGIYYFFRHTEDGHTLVIANTPQSHEELEYSPTLCFDSDRGGMEDEPIVYSWEKQQVLRSGKVTLWDHSFELPHKPLDAQEMVDEDLQVGDVKHKLKLAGNDKLELYDYPGGYAQRFDGIAPAGAERSGDLQKIYEDNRRTAKIRMQQETVSAVQITGVSDYLYIVPGYKFQLDRHYSDNDVYVITDAHVSIAQAGGYAAAPMDFAPEPEIVFHCIPYKLPYAPQRITPKPTIYGTQTAVVTGPAGEEIFTDKYGRVKVQFFWDREGKFDGTSSCWIRVASPWAGKQWGMVHIPRIGQEVVVAFEEGDPDQPIVVGSVYNSDQMPPHELPANKTQSGIKSRSTPGAGQQNLNEIRFEDKKGEEHIFMHGEKDIHVRSKASYFETVGGDFNQDVGGASRRHVKGKDSHHVEGDQAITVDGKQSIKVGSHLSASAGDTIALGSDQISGKGKNLVLWMSDTAISLNSGGSVIVEASTQITLKVGGNFIDINPGGIYIQGNMVYLNSGGGAGDAPAAAPMSIATPDAPAAAMKPGETKATANPAGSGAGSSTIHDENAEENKDKTHWIEVELKDEAGGPLVGYVAEFTLPNGKLCFRATNEKGLARVNKIDAGECTVRWLGLDTDAVTQ